MCGSFNLSLAEFALRAACLLFVHEPHGGSFLSSLAADFDDEVCYCTVQFISTYRAHYGCTTDEPCSLLDESLRRI